MLVVYRATKSAMDGSEWTRGSFLRRLTEKGRKKRLAFSGLVVMRELLSRDSLNMCSLK